MGGGNDLKLRSLTVTETNNMIKKMIESHPLFNSISINGEVSNLVIHSSGHCYFVIKDQFSRLPCIMFKHDYQANKHILMDGQKIDAHGRLSVYEKEGKYQYYVQSFQDRGYGDLFMKFEELKEKLKLLGYFEMERKRSIPKVKRAALITSLTGSVIKDVLNISKRRSRFTDFIVVPTQVQGADAPRSIIESIEKANGLNDVDVIILARGGGSIEDLWAFNDEGVARAIFNSKKPVVSAIGHETDFTISDFVADLRASTPSAAAELLVNEDKLIIDELRNSKYTMDYLIKSSIGRIAKELDYLSPAKSSFRLLSDVANRQFELETLGKSVRSNFTSKLDKAKGEVEAFASSLVSNNPLNIMKKGYTIVCGSDESIVGTIHGVKNKQAVKVRFHDGIADCRVENIEIIEKDDLIGREENI